ncbi:MAG: serpin family protein [Desulfobacteraceae bacterium]|jgi:serine protease inhibitor
MMKNTFKRYMVSKNYLFLIVAFLLATLTLSCGKSDNSDEVADNGQMTVGEYKQTATSHDDVTDGEPGLCDFTSYNEKALVVHRALGLKYDSEPVNRVVCTASLFSVIDMLAEGAVGETIEYMNERLPFLSDFQGCLSNPDLALTHYMWGQKEYRFSKEYLQILDTLTTPQFGELNFRNSAVTAVSEIASILDLTMVADEISSMTRMVLGATAAIDIETGVLAHVSERFDGLFENFDGIQYSKPHLRIQGEYGCFTSEDLRAVDVSSETSSLSMLFIFPLNEASLEALVQNLESRVPTIIAALQPEETSFAVPEFAIESLYDPSYILNLSLTDQNFSGVNGLGYLFVQDMIVHSRIELNFQSLTASGSAASILDATADEPDSVWNGWAGGVIYQNISLKQYIKEGIADSTPFLFIIRDKTTGAILFSGNLVRSGGTVAGQWVDSMVNVDYDPIDVELGDLIGGSVYILAH